MQTYFVKKIQNNIVYFYEDDFKHIVEVMRMQINDVIIVNYQGLSYEAIITKIKPFVSATVIKENINHNELKTHIDLFQASIKPSHFEWIVQKATELQVANIYQLILNRTYNMHLIKESRINKIIKEAAEQSSRLVLPNYYSEFSLDDLLKKANEYDLILVAYENIKNQQLAQLRFDHFSKIAIVIGGEGGFSIDEIDQLMKLKNVQLISLTKTILRSETASLYVLANLLERVN